MQTTSFRFRRRTNGIFTSNVNLREVMEIRHLVVFALGHRFQMEKIRCLVEEEEAEKETVVEVIRHLVAVG